MSAPCRKATRLLRIFVVGGDEDRATVIVDRLSGRRSLSGDTPEWEVVYEARSASEATEACAADLDRLDPCWFEVIDLKAVSIRRPTGLSLEGR